VFSGCGKADKSLLYFEKSIDIAGGVWEYDYFPEELITLVDTDYTLYNKKLIVLNSNETFWEFKAVKPGKFTFCWVYYNPGLWLNPEKSYAEDYLVDENLEIHSAGNYRPIYEIEKYDMLLFEQYIDEFRRHLYWDFEEYPDVSYLITEDYSNKIVNVEVNRANISDQNNISQIIDESFKRRIDNHNEVLHDTEINITFE
jgi:hypothetical protein